MLEEISSDDSDDEGDVNLGDEIQEESIKPFDDGDEISDVEIDESLLRSDNEQSADSGR